MKKKAFTLAEVMVVVGILGILVALATPGFRIHIFRARASEAIATMGLIREMEREYFSKHNAYLVVASPNLRNDPGHPTAPGLGIEVGTVQYFSNAAYSVALTWTVSHFTTAPTNPVDFLISANGNASVQCSGAITDCAVRANDIRNYRLEMDNTGRVVISYDSGTNWQAW